MPPVRQLENTVETSTQKLLSSSLETKFFTKNLKKAESLSRTGMKQGTRFLEESRRPSISQISVDSKEQRTE